MSKFNNIRKFSYETGSYSGYWDTADIDYFVDSEIGSDLNNGLTPATPFKTISKVKSLGTGIWQNGLVIACWGQFTENLVIDKVVTILGAGGYNGRAVFTDSLGLVIVNRVANAVFNNIFVNYGTDSNFNGFYASNCVLKKATLSYLETYYFYDIFLFDSVYPNAEGQDGGIFGRNISFVNCRSYFNNMIRINAHNVTTNNDIRYTTGTGTNRLVNTNARYFTDNTETTPADLYMDSANLNFGIKAVFDTPIWDKTAAAYITANPLYRTGTYNQYTRVNNHIGAGLEAISLTGLNDSLNDTVDATYTNFEKDENGILSRINDGIDGTIQGGSQDLGKVTRGVRISALHTYGFSGGVFNKHLGTSDYINDFEIQFGKTETECNNMPPIKCEYGKVISYYNDNGILYGNADANYDSTMSRVAEFRYYKIKITAQTV